MKRIVLMLTALLLTLSLVACSPMTIEAACKKADKMLVNWSKDQFASSTYEGEYEKIQGVYYYTVNARVSPAANSSENKEIVIAMCAREILDKVYPELEELFAKFDVDVIITVADSRGNVYCGIVDGKIVDLN